MLRNPDTYRYTNEGRQATDEVVWAVKEIYDKHRKNFSLEEVFYMITTAAHELILDEVLTHECEMRKEKMKL